MFGIKNKNIRYTPAKPQFFYMKVGFKGVNISRTCFLGVYCKPTEMHIFWNLYLQTEVEIQVMKILETNNINDLE